METKISPGLIRDEVKKQHYQDFNYAVACDDCTHFDPDDQTCLFMFPTTPFLKSTQLKELEENGHMAFCRAIEID